MHLACLPACLPAYTPLFIQFSIRQSVLLACRVLSRLLCSRFHQVQKLESFPDGGTAGAVLPAGCRLLSLPPAAAFPGQGTLGCFQPRAVRDTAAVNMCVSFDVSDFHFLPGWRAKGAVVGSQGKCVVTF